MDLTPTQQRIYDAVVRGEMDRSIARELGVKRETVRYHLREIARKLGSTQRPRQAIHRHYYHKRQ